MPESTAQFLAALRDSELPNDHALLPSAPSAGGWGDMLRLLAGTLPDQPCIVVLDELPWLAEQDDTFDGSPLLRQLTDDKQVLAADQPLSTSSSKPALYRVADSNLRLHLAILRDVHNLTQRGRPDAGYALFQNRWTGWRGRAVEPLVRTSLEQATVTGALPWPQAQVVGGWWNRQFNPEIDLVGADRAPVAAQIQFCGSVKWLGTPFDTRDLHQLRDGVRQVPGFDAGHTGLIAVTRSGANLPADAVDVVWGPDEIVAAWQP